MQHSLVGGSARIPRLERVKRAPGRDVARVWRCDGGDAGDQPHSSPPSHLIPGYPQLLRAKEWTNTGSNKATHPYQITWWCFISNCDCDFFHCFTLMQYFIVASLKSLLKTRKDGNQMSVQCECFENILMVKDTHKYWPCKLVRSILSWDSHLAIIAPRLAPVHHIQHTTKNDPQGLRCEHLQYPEDLTRQEISSLPWLTPD